MSLTMLVQGHAVSIPALIVLGTTVGFLAGIFGVGGGFLLTPLLSVVFGIPLPIAVGSGLCQMVGTSTSAFLRHRKAGNSEVRFDLIMLLGSLIGVDAGARALSWLARAGTVRIASHSLPLITLVLESSYIALLVLVSLVFWRQARGSAEQLEYVRSAPLARINLGARVDLPAVPLREVSAVVIAEIGLALGFLSGLLGIGGGVALMPVLIYGFGFPIRQASGTGIIVLFATSSLGTFLHALQGHVDLRLAMVLLVGASISAQFGAQLTQKLPARQLRKLFALLVMSTVIAVSWDLIRRIL